MKAKTFKLSNKDTIVIIENEHKEVFLIKAEEIYANFFTFEQALKWVQKEVLNGSYDYGEYF